MGCGSSNDTGAHDKGGSRTTTSVLPIQNRETSDFEGGKEGGKEAQDTIILRHQMSAGVSNYNIARAPVQGPASPPWKDPPVSPPLKNPPPTRSPTKGADLQAAVVADEVDTSLRLLSEIDDCSKRMLESTKDLTVQDAASIIQQKVAEVMAIINNAHLFTIAKSAALQRDFNRRLSTQARAGATAGDRVVAKWLLDSTDNYEEEDMMRASNKLNNFHKQRKSASMSRSEYHLSLGDARDARQRKASLFCHVTETLNDPALDRHLKNINNWDFDVWDFTALTQGRPLLCLMTHIFDKLYLFEQFDIPREVFIKFISAIEEGYIDNPYHSNIHAADVVQNIYCFLVGEVHYIDPNDRNRRQSQPGDSMGSIDGPVDTRESAKSAVKAVEAIKGLSDKVTSLDILAALVAAAVHDYKHPGTNNQFSVNTQDVHALTYNDRSVLENYHLAETFKLMKQPEYDIFGHLPKEDQKELRGVIISMVLATDMQQHVKLVSELKAGIAEKKTTEKWFQTSSNKDRLLVLKAAIHCADIANPSKRKDIYLPWVDRLVSEWHMQGDAERAMGLPVMPMLDRRKHEPTRYQLGFINFFITPLYEAWIEVAPHAQVCMDYLESNRLFWEAEAAKPPISKLKPPGDTGAGSEASKSNGVSGVHIFVVNSARQGAPSSPDQNSLSNSAPPPGGRTNPNPSPTLNLNPKPSPTSTTNTDPEAVAEHATRTAVLAAADAALAADENGFIPSDGDGANAVARVRTGPV